MLQFYKWCCVTITKVFFDLDKNNFYNLNPKIFIKNNIVKQLTGINKK